MKLSQSLVTEATFEINLSSPELYSKMSDRATQRILIEKKKKKEDLHYSKESSYLQYNSYKS